MQNRQSKLEVKMNMKGEEEEVVETVKKEIRVQSSG